MPVSAIATRSSESPSEIGDAVTEQALARALYDDQGQVCCEPALSSYRGDNGNRDLAWLADRECSREISLVWEHRGELNGQEVLLKLQRRTRA